MILPGKPREYIIFYFLLTLYTVWTYFFVGFRSDHFWLIIILALLFTFSKTGLKLVYSFLFFLIYWIIFDSLRLFPSYSILPVNIEEVYNFELKFFGVLHDGIKITLNEFYGFWNNNTLDIICGVFYLLWVPAPMLFMFYCFFTGRRKIVVQYWFAFLLANLIGFVGYYAYPAAPPWYYEEFGNVFHVNTPSNAARLLRFDAFFGIDLFGDMYSKGSNVFAAIPSMHSAFPVLLMFYARQLKSQFINYLFAVLTLGIWFSAIYLNHHYIIDVILGVLCAILTILIIKHWLMRPINRLLNIFYEKVV